jgi:predicted thioesterase
MEDSDSKREEESHQTKEMLIEQAGREARERELADEDPTKAGTQTHERRAAKAEYLKQKLAEREKSEREAG